MSVPKMLTPIRILISVTTCFLGFDSTSFPAVGDASINPASYAQEVRNATVTATADTIVIDGILDEPAWQAAPKIGDLIQRQPDTGEKPSERSEITLLYDADFLYIGVVAYDSDPQKVIGTQMARDAGLSSDDRLEIILDTFRDQRNAFYFATNPSGALVDGLAFANEQLNTDWDAIWNLRARQFEQGWIAEIAIPFKSLSFPSGESVWGFNIERTIYRKQEENRWSGARLETQFLQISEAGEINGLAGLNQGMGLDIRPFIAASWLDSDTGEDDGFEFEPGIDLFYNITPSLKLTGTINTDFGETEVDERLINLSRFSLFLPEKRSFFLEDAGVFAFASTGPKSPGGIPNAGADVYPFFSRRIGLLSGQEVPIDVGLKLTGKVKRSEIGLLNVRTGSTSSVENKDFYVGRFKQNLLEQSYIGGIFTSGNPNPGEEGKTYGADMRLATSSLGGGDKNLAMNAYYVRSENDDISDDNASFGFSAHYPNDKYVGEFVYREIQKNFRPALGFVQRSNVRMYRAGASYNPRPDSFLNIQQMFHDIFYTRFERLDNGLLESSELHITPVDWHFRSGDAFHSIADYTRGYERLFEPFEISPGVVLQPGEYRTTRFKALIATAGKRRLSGSINTTWGDFWSGTAETVSASVTCKIPPRFTFSFRANQTFAHLPEGDFIARILTSNLNYSVSPFLSFSNLFQYDNRSRNLGWQSRMRWTLQPGSDLFLVFNQGWIQDDIGGFRFNTQDTKISSKFQYTYRF